MKERMKLTNIQKMIFEEWVVEHLARLSNIVPPEIDDTRALIYNIVQAIRGSPDRYEHREDQDQEIASWNLDAFLEEDTPEVEPRQVMIRN